MSLISTVQRRSARGRLIYAMIYLVLAAGGLVMIYPFLLMCSGSVRSEVDSRDFSLVPRYLYDDNALFQKYVEQRYNFSVAAFTAATGAEGNDGSELFGFSGVRLHYGPSVLLSEWVAFLNAARAGMPPHFFRAAHSAGYRTVPELVYRFRDFLRENGLGLGALGTGWQSLDEDWVSRRFQPQDTDAHMAFRAFRDQLPDRFLAPASVDAAWRQFLTAKYGPGPTGLAALNSAWATLYSSLGSVVISKSLPPGGAEAADWSEFIRHSLSSRFLVLDDKVNSDFREMLRKTYSSPAEIGAAGSWDGYRYSNVNPSPAEQVELERLLSLRDNLSGVMIDSIDTRWRDYLANHPNAQTLAPHGGWSTAALPLLAEDADLMRTNRKEITWEFLTRNYRIALDETVFSGNAFRNTIIFCLLNVLTALVINPIAAYALSRFQPRWGSAVLFILMATMAFPAEVTQIPSFLLLRDLNLLNTFAALVIPAAANGYSIFLLKGFFDSLPQDLYEAATIDGCGELNMFARITVPLSGPILAVVALGAFTSAYGAFMFALLVCQNESMWTLMVYIYQLQQTQNQSVVFAALILASIPTLVVFAVCQKFILRGIAVPVEK